MSLLNLSNYASGMALTLRGDNIKGRKPKKHAAGMALTLRGEKISPQKNIENKMHIII